MDISALKQQQEICKKRFDNRAANRERNIRLIEKGKYLQVDTPIRVKQFLERNGFSEPDVESMILNKTEGLPKALLPVEGKNEPDALERVLGVNDFMGIAFLEKGLQVAKSIGRIWIGVEAGRPMGYGTGFMISPRLLMTNNHVLPTLTVARKSIIEFNYELGLDGTVLPSVSFTIDPDTFYFTDAVLDYSIVAIRPTNGNSNRLVDFGWNPLIEEQGKAIISQYLNIIQHPNGEAKQLCLRENQMIDLLDDFLHYKTDTAPGSSGSPVLNDRWEVVALHHSGVWETNNAGQIMAIDGRVWKPEMGEHRIKWIANEGVRISKIIGHLRNLPMSSMQKSLFEEIFSSPPILNRPELNRTSQQGLQDINSPVQLAADGTATWTIPVSLSVKVGDTAFKSALAGQALQRPVDKVINTPAVADTKPSSQGPEDILVAAKKEFSSRADVLNVRLGYVFKDGWITNDRAIVITVRKKLPLQTLAEANISALPENYYGLPVEVTTPTLEQLIAEAKGPELASEAFPLEAVSAREIIYTPPANASLDEVNEKMRVIAHVSPDAGWTQLQPFLASAGRKLVVGMYDFGAPHIVDEISTAGKKRNFKEMKLVMQKGESAGTGTKKDDLKDQEVVDRFENDFGNKFENAWVKIGRVNGWVSSSYHIKVAVKDQKTLWLSSGNWQSSNQPDADPLKENPANRVWLDKFNREWHAIIEHPGLAKTFEKFILHDFTENLQIQAEEFLALPDLLIPEVFLVPSAVERQLRFKYFKPFDENRKFKVQPLLTPDNYFDHVIQLVKSADQELLIQNQTFNAPKPNHEKLKELMTAILEKQQEGVDVKIIFRILISSVARENIENLKAFGFDTSIIKVQKNCHTKGIIADRKVIMLGSQNFSNDGVSVNRDASLIFHDEKLAKYFADIFDHDWNILAKQNIGRESMEVIAAPGAETTPAGMIRLTWKDYMEMM